MEISLSQPALRKFFYQRRDLPLRALAHAGAAIPLILLAVDVLRQDLTVNPIQYIEQRTGFAALILLVVSLACTPLNTVAGLRWAVKVRRTLGLWAFFYALTHFLVFIGLDYGFDLGLLPEAILEKPYALVGFSTFLILLALAVTSFDWWKRKLRKNWTRLHNLVYLAGGLAVLHFAWARKGDIFRLQGDIVQPLIFTGIVALLLVVRVPPIKRVIVNTRRSLAVKLARG